MFQLHERSGEPTEIYRAAVRTFANRLCPEGISGVIMPSEEQQEAWQKTLEASCAGSSRHPEMLPREELLRDAGELRAKLWSGKLTHLAAAADPTMPIKSP
jgi:hypothetical protein